MQKVPCPRCQKMTPWENNPFRPFCSERCRLIDLGKWASDEYAIPGEAVSDTSDTPAKADESDEDPS